MIKRLHVRKMIFMLFLFLFVFHGTNYLFAEELDPDIILSSLDTSLRNQYPEEFELADKGDAEA